MENNRLPLVRKYATAFVNVFGASFNQQQLDAIGTCAQTLAELRNLIFFLQLTSLPDQLKRAALEKIIIAQCGLPGSFSSLINLLIMHKRSFLITPIIAKIHRLALKRKGIALFNIRSSSALDENQKKSLLQFLEHKTDMQIVGNYTIDTKLIAGVRMQSDTLLWEQSIRKYLADVQLSLTR